MPRSCTWSLPFRFSDKNFVCISHLSHACYISHSFHPPWFGHPNNVWKGYTVRSLSLCSFLHPVVTEWHFNRLLWNFLLLQPVDLFKAAEMSLCISLNNTALHRNKIKHFNCFRWFLHVQWSFLLSEEDAFTCAEVGIFEMLSPLLPYSAMTLC